MTAAHNPPGPNFKTGPLGWGRPGLEDGDGEPVGARLALAFRGGDGEIEHREFVVFAIGIRLGMDGSVGTQVTQQRETVHIEIPLKCAAIAGQRW